MNDVFNAQWTGEPVELEKKIKEEVTKRYGWLSINRYGAICLNSNRVLFGDIDCRIDLKSGRTKQLVHTEEDALKFVENVSETQGLSFRVYQTYAGLRLIEITKKHNPNDPTTIDSLKLLGCDPFFIELTETTKTFRARLTPKPWRATASVVNFRSAQNNISEYLRGNETNGGPEWQVAKFLKTVGTIPENLDPEIDFIIQFHDEFCLTNDDRPLA